MLSGPPQEKCHHGTQEPQACPCFYGQVLGLLTRGRSQRRNVCGVRHHQDTDTRRDIRHRQLQCVCFRPFQRSAEVEQGAHDPFQLRLRFLGLPLSCLPAAERLGLAVVGDLGDDGHARVRRHAAECVNRRCIGSQTQNGRTVKARTPRTLARSKASHNRLLCFTFACE